MNDAVVEKEPRSGRLSTSTTDENIDKIEELVPVSRRLSQRDLFDIVGISKNDLGLSRMPSRLVSNLLEKQLCFQVSKEVLSMSNNGLKCVINDDEPWI